MGHNHPVIQQRFFRASHDVYETVRAGLDSQWGHGAGRPTLTCFEPAFTAPKDKSGQVLLAVRSEFCEYEVAAQMLPVLIDNNLIEEISKQEYMASVQIP